MTARQEWPPSGAPARWLTTRSHLALARIHRSTIVKLDRVKEMQPSFSSDFIVPLTDGAELRLSRAYRERLERRGLGASP